MYIKSFIKELSKKIETVDSQLKEFESKMEKINEVTSMLTLKTLKDIESLKGEDLILLSNDEFIQILNVFKFEAIDEKLKTFADASLKIRTNQKLISDGELEVEYNEEIEKYTNWLDEQVKYIKEYIDDFNNNNKEYYNSLKISDALYKKYIGFFKDEKLIKPIHNMEEFNELIKKSGIITSEKWQLLKYVGEKNLDFFRKEEANKKDTVEYSDDEIINFVETILLKEKSLIETITDESVDYAIAIFDKTEEEIDKLNLTEDDIVRYQKMPILDALNKLFKETKRMLKTDEDKDALKIEKNFKDLLKLVDSYNVIKKIES